MSSLNQSQPQQKLAGLRSVQDDPLDLRDKIVDLQKSQLALKQSIIETDVALKSPAMSHRESIMSRAYKREQQEFGLFLSQYKNLSNRQRKPYQAMMKKFQSKINEHKEEIALARDEPAEFKKKLESQRQVWFENEEVEEERWKFLLRGVLGVLGAFLFHLMIGAFGRWAIINPYLSSFYKLTSDPSIETRRNAIGSPLMMFCVGVTMKWGLRRGIQFGRLKLLLLASLGLALAVFLASLMTHILGFLAFHNVMYGLCAGCLFITPMKELHKYFPKYRLVCNSVVLSGTGLGAVFWGKLNTRCMNPLQEQPYDSGYFTGDRDYIARNLPYCLVQMSIVLLIVSALALLCIYSLVQYNSREDEIKLQKGQLPDFENSCYTDSEALKSGVFWLLTALIICGSLGNFYMVMNYKNLVKAESNREFRNENLLMAIVFSGGLCNGLFRIVWGLLFRSWGFKYTYLLAVGLNILVFTLFITTPITYPSYLVMYTVAGIVGGGFMVIFPNVCLLVYGQIIGDSIYGFYWAAFSFSNFLQYLVGSNIKEISTWIRQDINANWVPFNVHKIVFYPFILLCLISVAIIVAGRFQGRWENSLKLLTLKCE